MNVNTCFLKFSINDRLSVRIQAENETGAKMDVYLNKAEWRHALSILRSEADFYPYYSDVNYLVRVSWDGFTYVKLSEYEPSQKAYFTFPLQAELGKLGMLDESLWASEDNQGWEWSGEYISRIKRDYSPDVKWAYSDHNNYGLEASLSRYTLNTMTLGPSLLRLQSIAANYSNGIAGNATVNISFDQMPDEHIPDSYYFWIETQEGYKIINGGIIFHADYDYESKRFGLDENGMITGHYSMHT